MAIVAVLAVTLGFSLDGRRRTLSRRAGRHFDQAAFLERILINERLAVDKINDNIREEQSYAFVNPGLQSLRLRSWVALHERQAMEHREQAEMRQMRLSRLQKLAIYHRQLGEKYRKAVDRPWASVTPDPPMPWP